MSRNFELLQKLDQEQEVFRSVAGSPVNSHSVAGEPRERIPGPLTAPVGKDAQITRLVHRLFFRAEEMSRVAAVSFSAVDHTQNAVAARVGELLAQSSNSVCAVDADFSRPTLHGYFGICNDRGIAQALLQPGPIESFGQQLEDGLTVFPTGNVTRESESAALSSAMIARFADLRAQYDFVLIQSPPLTMMSNASVLGSLSDGVVLIVEAHRTRRDLAAKLNLELQHNKVAVLGAVLNNRTYPIPQKLYSKLF
jgi:Mrp family chromosome partitioning ATPase